MIGIKKIDVYVLKRFFNLFLMTFFICILILLMQFLWKHFADLVGKGVGVGVILEFFIYAIFSVVPMALPLAILLASIMTFGNLSENFELTAMKSAGISLFRIIRPLVVFVILLSIGAFFFSNNVLPRAETKLWTLIFSLRYKTPELDIPVGEFYSGISGYNIYVRGKDNGLLKNLMIYDFSGGFENASIKVADSGRVHFTKDKKFLLLTLYSGESFENLKKQKVNSSENVPYRRETFSVQEIILDFDSEFSRMDESMLEGQHISKNLSQLKETIDSVNKQIDIRTRILSNELVEQKYFGRENEWGRTLEVMESVQLKNYNPDSLMMSLTQEELEQSSAAALNKANEMKGQVDYNILMLSEKKYVSRHEIQWHRKFTLPFACFIFFFIGAPLGAIIRKGGLGMPVVISVLMFIIYYIIDNTGYKMTRENIWPALQGMWMSSMILLPVGIFLTYKAAIDATVLNTSEYSKLWVAFQLKWKQLTQKIKK